MGLSTKDSGNKIKSYKETRKLPYFQTDLMKSKLGIKNNKLNKLPNNVPY